MALEGNMSSPCAEEEAEGPGMGQAQEGDTGLQELSSAGTKDRVWGRHCRAELPWCQSQV